MTTPFAGQTPCDRRLISLQQKWGENYHKLDDFPLMSIRYIYGLALDFINGTALEEEVTSPMKPRGALELASQYYGGRLPSGFQLVGLQGEGLKRAIASIHETVSAELDESDATLLQEVA